MQVTFTDKQTGDQLTAPEINQIKTAINTNAGTTQVHTTGSAVTVGNSVSWLIVNPATLLSSLNVTLKANPVDRDEVEISFGGTITSGNVITTLNISGGSVVGNINFSNIQVGDVIRYRYNNNNTKWYQVK